MGIVKKEISNEIYKKFDQVNGSHPFKKVLPNGFVDYPARIRRGGKVSTFNFDLAREMGFISKTHDNELNKELTQKILETFSVMIINEYDQMNAKKFKKEDMKEGTYMATRYLQLQHDDKKGLNSGDGRSVWLGQVKGGGKTWDISACGTGATRLSPATSQYNRFFESGDPTISYGCGYAELDEGIATSVLSKIFHYNNHVTEQTLCVIEFKNDISINVRVHTNLFRPSHFFLYLKQNDQESLKKITDYYIARQVNEKFWLDCPSSKNKYEYFLEKITETFARTSADFEDEYIFCWLDWDGDNILMDGGIIDYGSIRQFGIFHHEYRYDDVERFSTSILEQKSKARYIVQTFIQAIDFIKTGEKESVQSFAGHKALEKFDHVFEEQKNLNLLKKIGLSEKKSKQVLKRETKLIEDFRKVFSYFEKAKVKTGIVKIPDGKTCDAVFNMRNILRELPQILLSANRLLSSEEFIDISRSWFAEDVDVELNSYRKTKITQFQSLYKKILKQTSKHFREDYDETLLSALVRSQVINKPNRVTGDAITHIVDLIMKNRKQLPPESIYALIQDLVHNQNLDPDRKINFIQKEPKGLLLKLLEIIKEHREGI